MPGVFVHYIISDTIQSGTGPSSHPQAAGFSNPLVLCVVSWELVKSRCSEAAVKVISYAERADSFLLVQPLDEACGL